MKVRGQSWKLAAVAGFALAGLSGASSGGCGGGGADDAGAADAATPDAGFVLTCQDSTDPLVTAYKTGLTATSLDGQMKVTFMSASPEPPADNLNSWNVQVTDAAGNPLPNLPLVVKLYMPQMNHGANDPWVDGGESGNYTISEINLFMPGIWQITFVEAMDGGESAQIDFCITG